MANQIKWTAKLADGTSTHVFTKSDATEQEARELLNRLMKSAWQNTIMDSSPSRHPVVLGQLATDTAKRDFSDQITSIERA